MVTEWSFQEFSDSAIIDRSVVEYHLDGALVAAAHPSTFSGQSHTFSLILKTRFCGHGI